MFKKILFLAAMRLGCQTLEQVVQQVANIRFDDVQVHCAKNSMKGRCKLWILIFMIQKLMQVHHIGHF